MSWFTRTRIETDAPARSLCWRGDELVDWVRGGDRWTADGRFHPARVSWGYARFDGAITDPTGRWAFVHERTGTAGLLVRDEEIVREIHRSPYHADAYLYPACLFQRDDRVVLAHCPDSYARIEFDDAETGERLTRSTTRKETDFFHSRLAVSPGGKRLMSAGWVWQPWDMVVWFDIAAAIADPARLDVCEGASGGVDVSVGEESSGAWLDDDHVLLGGSVDAEDAEDARFQATGIAVFDLSARRYTRGVDLDEPAGTMMPAGPDHVVTFFGRPRLVSLTSGKVVHEWADIDSGHAVSSIVRDLPCPPLALDPARARFAVAGEQGIDVVTIEVRALAREHSSKDIGGSRPR